MSKFMKRIKFKMNTITYTEARNNFAPLIDKVVENHTPTIVTRQKKESVVLISLEDFKSYQETIYLLQSRKNGERLNRSIQELEQGLGTERDLIE